MNATATALDAAGFYRELGHGVPNRSGEYIPTRCLVHPERHKHGDKSPSASVSTSTGVHICGVCGSSSPWEIALLKLGSRSAAWDLCVKYGLRSPDVTQDLRSEELGNLGSVSGHSVTSWVTPHSEEELLRLLDEYSAGDTHAEPVEYRLPNDPSKFEEEYAARIALLLGLLRGGTLLLSRKTALKVMRLELTQANISKVRRANGRFKETFDIDKAERLPGMAHGTTTFKALWQKRPTGGTPGVSEHNDGGSQCGPSLKMCSAPRDAEQSRSPAPSTDATPATSSPPQEGAMPIAESPQTSDSGSVADSTETEKDWNREDDGGLGAGWVEQELQRMIDSERSVG